MHGAVINSNMDVLKRNWGRDTDMGVMINSNMDVLKPCFFYRNFKIVVRLIVTWMY